MFTTVHPCSRCHHTSPRSHPLLLHPHLPCAPAAEAPAQAPSPPRESQVSQAQHRGLPLAQTRSPEPARPPPHGFSPSGKAQLRGNLPREPGLHRRGQSPGDAPTGSSPLPPGSADRTLASSSPPEPGAGGGGGAAAA